jgi:hypothetical protein
MHKNPCLPQLLPSISSRGKKIPDVVSATTATDPRIPLLQIGRIRWIQRRFATQDANHIIHDIVHRRDALLRT